MSSLAVSDKSFVSEWHPTRNLPLTPDRVSYGSKQLVWWQCSEGHEWEMGAGYRSKGFSCPVCVSFGFLHPDIAVDWHPTKNEKTPFKFRANSGVKVWWLGKECGHEWDSDIRGRVRSGYGCPFCVNQRILPGFNDLVTTHPELAAEWHPEKNGDLTPEQVTYGSKRKVWWVGKDCGHEWFSSILPRASQNVGCGVCRGLQVQIGVNDLATTHPEVATLWHAEKNKYITVDNVSSGSDKKVWWLGECGHEWEGTIYARTSGYGCPICSNHRVIENFNDFAFTHPNIASQWHPTKNGSINPNALTFGSNFKAFWVCENGHIWIAKVADRCVKGSNCPQCQAGSSVSKPEKELADYITGLGFKVETSIRSVIKGELDIYVPEKQVAVEFNGLYWHSEIRGKDKNYHYDKWLACKEQGIQLIQVWEEEFRNNPEQVKRMIAHKLGVSQQQRVAGRETVVSRLTGEQVAVFLNKYHIQGYVSGYIYVGLVKKGDPDTVLAVMVLKNEPGSEGKILNLLRFATSQQVTGGFTKLLKYVERTYNPDSVVTFSDNCVSDGGLYDLNGFVKVRELSPDYKYVVRGERVHKFRYRLKRFREDPELKYVEGLSERELALLNNLPRIWDAGKVKWVKSFGK